MNDKPFFDTNVILCAFRRGDSRGQAAETLLAAGGALSVQVLNEFAAPLVYFAFFVQSPSHLRSRPTREPWTLRSDAGIQSLTYSSSRLRSMPDHRPGSRGIHAG